MTTNSGNPIDESVADPMSAAASRFSDRAAQVKDQMKGKVSEAGRLAVEKIDGNRDAAASGLDSAASALRRTAGSLPGGERVSEVAHATAGKLSNTADYVRDHNVNRMMSDVETLVKNNPGPALIAAAFVGFLAGRVLSRAD